MDPIDHGHIPVLMDETLQLLDPQPGDVVLDCTAGRGGHACALARRIGERGHLVLCDRDEENLAHATSRVAEFAPGTPVTTIHGSFVEMPRRMADSGLSADVVLADLGFASTQMDDPERGLSFSGDGPLDMRFDRSQGPTAADLLATLSAHDLADIIFRYGEDPFSRRIAQKLVESRATEPITQSGRLAELVREAYGPRARQSRMHPATRTFMALRIAVNDELGALAALLDDIDRGSQQTGATEETPMPTSERPARGWLRSGARIGIISFHSLEDRMVKRAFRALSDDGRAERLTKKPIQPSDAECASNPRARSAKLRVVRLA